MSKLSVVNCGPRNALFDKILRTAMNGLNKRSFEDVDSYALDRLHRQGDVYGWVPLEGDLPQALLLISRSAALNSFPEEIAGVQIKLEQIDPPEMDTHCD